MSITILTHPPALIMARQPVVFTIDSSSTESPLRLSGGVVDVGSDSVPADVDNEARFNFSDYLQGLTTERHKLTTTPSKYTGAVTVVEFAFAELYGTPPTSHNAITTSEYSVIDGFVPRNRRKAFYASYASMLAYLISSKSCLTWWPSNESKKVLPTQKEIINHLQVHSGTAVSLQLKVTLLYTDNSTDNMGNVYSSVASVGYLDMVYFPVGYTELGIAAWVASNNPGKTVRKYYISIYDSATLVSKIYSFDLDQNYYENPRYLYIRNPFGMLEILLCTGLSSAVSEYSSEKAVTDGQITQDKLTWYNRKADLVKVVTGFMTKAQIQWLSELLETTEAYELISGVLVPIVLRDPKIATAHDGEYQYSAEIDYEYAYTEPIETGS